MAMLGTPGCAQRSVPGGANPDVPYLLPAQYLCHPVFETLCRFYYSIFNYLTMTNPCLRAHITPLPHIEAQISCSTLHIETGNKERNESNNERKKSVKRRKKNKGQKEKIRQGQQQHLGLAKQARGAGPLKQSTHSRPPRWQRMWLPISFRGGASDQGQSSAHMACRICHVPREE
jgi:hypothetical protein